VTIDNPVMVTPRFGALPGMRSNTARSDVAEMVVPLVAGMAGGTITTAAWCPPSKAIEFPPVLRRSAEKSSLTHDALIPGADPHTRKPIRSSCGSVETDVVCAFHAANCSVIGPADAIAETHGSATVPDPVAAGRESSASSSAK
jgi:hypothetical protein